MRTVFTVTTAGHRLEEADTTEMMRMRMMRRRRRRMRRRRTITVIPAEEPSSYSS